MAVRRTISTTSTTLVNIPINLLKGNWIFTLRESVAVLETISTTYITITLLNTITNILKLTCIFTLVYSVAVLKTIYTTHITILGITILLRKSVFQRKIATTHITRFLIIVNKQHRIIRRISNTCR